MLRQLEVVELEALQDKRLINFVHQEVAVFQDMDNVEVNVSGYLMLSVVCVVHRSFAVGNVPYAAIGVCFGLFICVFVSSGTGCAGGPLQANHALLFWR